MRVFVGFTRRRNLVLGLDLADYVEAVGSAVRRFKVGEAVIAFTGKHFWSLCRVCLPARRGCARPAGCPDYTQTNLSYAEAAAVPSRGGLAWQFFIDPLANQELLMPAPGSSEMAPAATVGKSEETSSSRFEPVLV